MRGRKQFAVHFVVVSFAVRCAAAAAAAAAEAIRSEHVSPPKGETPDLQATVSTVQLNFSIMTWMWLCIVFHPGAVVGSGGGSTNDAAACRARSAAARLALSCAIAILSWPVRVC